MNTSDTTPPVAGEKLQKVLARAGLGSRREMEGVISSGRVLVNDEPAKLGDRVSPEDKISLDGEVISTKVSDKDVVRVLLYNKPEGQICSQSDPEGRPTVFEHLPKLSSGRWISVGRLDFNTSGLLLFTNDGDLAHKLMHPSSNIDREYLVRVQGEIKEDTLSNLKAGVKLDDGVAKFTDVVPGAQEGSNRWFYCVVMEGKNREVRRLWESQDCRVSRLKRVRYGCVFIPSHVRVGQWMELEEKELKELYGSVDLVAPKQKFSAELKSFRDRQKKRLHKPGSSFGTPKTKAPTRSERHAKTHAKAGAKTGGKKGSAKFNAAKTDESANRSRQHKNNIKRNASSHTSSSNKHK